MNNEMSRRDFLETSALALTATSLGGVSRAADARQVFVYVARDCSNPPGQAGGPAGGIAFFGSPVGGGIDVFRVNMADGSLHPVSSTGPEAADLSSGGMTVSDDGRFLYCLNRTTALKGVPGTGGGVYAFAIDRSDGSLRYLGNQPSMGAMPTAVRIDKTNSRAIVSNHGAVSRVCLVVKRNGVPVIERPTDSATVALYAVGPDGSLGVPLDVHVLAEQPVAGDEAARPLSAALGPSATVQVGAACHGCAFDRTQRWIIATDNGYDYIYVYPFSTTARHLEGKAYPLPPGRAPRHVAVHPQAPYFFVTNEREPSVSAFHFDSGTGEPRLIQTIATVADGDTSAPPGPTKDRLSPADIRLHPSGKFLYASTRGAQDTMAAFAVDTATGRLTRVDVQPTGGAGQSEFNIDPTGRFLFACNSRSNNVTSFMLDATTGKMTAGPTLSTPRPAIVDFVAV